MTWNWFLSQVKHQDAYMAVLLQPEQQGLEELYALEIFFDLMVVGSGSLTISGELGICNSVLAFNYLFLDTSKLY